jgi:hypothetical protein
MDQQHCSYSTKLSELTEWKGGSLYSIHIYIPKHTHPVCNKALKSNAAQQIGLNTEVLCFGQIHEHITECHSPYWSSIGVAASCYGYACIR